MSRIGSFLRTVSNFAADIRAPELHPHSETPPWSRNWWIALVVNAFCDLYFDIEFIDTYNVPERGAAIVAANHFSHLDGLLINAATIRERRRPVVFLAAADVYNSNRAFRLMCDLVNCIPVKRDENDRAALLRTIRLLKEGRLFGIFPEGQRSRDGTIGEGKEGVAVIAVATGCPVIPVGISGTFEALPRKTKLIKPAKVKLKFGQPLRYKKERHPPAEKIAAIRDEIMDAIKGLHAELVEDEGGKKGKMAA